MNGKKILISLVAIMLLLSTILLQSVSYAKSVETGKELIMGVLPLMENSTPHMGYAINNPKTGNLGENKTAAKIWNIVKYTGETQYENPNFYCVKAGVGFVRGENETLRKAPYNLYFNMKTEREEIKKQGEQNGVLKTLVESNFSENGTTINQYNAILAVLDMMYLPGESTENDKKQIIFNAIKDVVNKDESEYKTNPSWELMNKAFELPAGMYDIDFIEENQPTKYSLRDGWALTDNEINAVNQAVLWYFSNYYKVDETVTNTYKETTEHETLYDKVGQHTFSWLNYTTDDETYHVFTSSEDAVGQGNNVNPINSRAMQAGALYEYMISEAKKNASQYENISQVSGTPVTVDTKTLKQENSGDNYIIGPIHMTKKNPTPFTIDFKVKNNGSEISNYQLLNSQKQQVTATIESLVGSDFYLSVPKDQVKDFSIDINVKYNDKTMTLWASSTNELTQPLVEVKTEEVKEPVTLKLEPLPEKFDLKLIKRITAVNDKPVAERIKSVDVSKLNREVDANGNLTETTAKYKMTKDPVSVVKGDIVTYTFRVYNEGTIDGYAKEITEEIPEGLQFLGTTVGEDMQPITDKEELAAVEFNAQNGWSYVQGDMTKIKTTNLALHPIVNGQADTVSHTENLIPAFGHNDGTKTEQDLKYKEISVKFKVTADLVGKAIRNEAAITNDTDKDGDPIDDRDSKPEEWKKDPDDEFYDDDKKWPIYKEDDEDYDNIILPSFDLALRKFIVAVSKDETIEENEYLKNANGSYKREPAVDTSKLNTVGADGKLITTADYNHTKEPVIVQANDIVVYMLRAYNEGEVDGYAAQIKDHLPPHLEYVESDFNKQYGWKVAEDGRTVTTDYLSADEFLIKKAEANESGKIELSYKEVPIMCRVKETAPTSQNITNIADITKYLDASKNPVTDRDSQENNVNLPADKDLPGYKGNETGSYVPGQQDDDDFEKVVIKIFDLALRKWVTEAIVIENGGQTVTQTGHDPWDDPEDVVKVELHRKKLDEVVVKFRYSIRIYNQGEVEGYAKEITDYIPEGLKFVAEDNPGWVDEGNNVISTKLLENTLLQPGESADVEVLLTWINNEDNMGVMTNTAEISIDDNPYDLPDIDSTPDNQKPGEDDIDDAPVMLSISTGQARIYFTLGFVVLITVAGGVVLIKRYVL